MLQDTLEGIYLDVSHRFEPRFQGSDPGEDCLLVLVKVCEALVYGDLVSDLYFVHKVINYPVEYRFTSLQNVLGGAQERRGETCLLLFDQVEGFREIEPAVIDRFRFDHELLGFEVEMLAGY